MFGGEDESDRSMNSVICLDLCTHNWFEPQIKGMISPRFGHSSVIYNNQMIVFGGDDGKQRFNDVTCLDLKLWKWSEIQVKGTIPKMRVNHVACVDKENMFVFGGWDCLHSFNDLHSFHFPTSTWTIIEILNAPCRVRSNAAIIDDNLIIFGGEDDKMFLQNTLLTIPLCNKAKAQILRADISSVSPPDVFGHVSGVIDSFFVVMGGYAGEMNLISDVFAFSLKTSRWYSFRSNNYDIVGRDGHSGFVFDKSLYIFGGRNIEMQKLSDAFKIDLAFDSLLDLGSREDLWSCQVCTFQNNWKQKYCLACDSPGSQNFHIPSLVEWACKVCTFENRPNNQNCEICGSSK